MDSESLERVEKRRLELEDHVAKLKKAIRHWQTLELDYDVLRDEFTPLPENASKDACLQAVKDSGIELINEKEMNELLTTGKDVCRKPSQVVELLSKRLEYVARNITTLRNQLSDAERKRNALLLAEDPALREDAGLPLAEITEELDEQGNVVTSKVQNPGQQSAGVEKILQKADVRGLANDASIEQDAHKIELDTEESADAPPTDQTEPQGNTSDRVEEIESEANAESEDDLSTTDEHKLQAQEMLFPTNLDDSEEDAQLRQEMLRYGLDEIVPIVAELEVGENHEDFSDDEDDFDDDSLEDNEDEDEDAESEDETGRTRRPRISNSYRKQMEELEKSLGLKDIKNLGPSPELPSDMQRVLNRPTAAEAARKAAIARAEAGNKSEDGANSKATDGKTGKKPAKKTVSFASSLDIADNAVEKDSAHVPTSSSTSLPERPRVKPIGENVVERSAGQEPQEATAAKSKKVSKFKAARTSIPQTPLFPPPMELLSHDKAVPEGPPGKTIADSLVERDVATGESNVPPPNDSDDGFDEEMHKREVASEYYKMRNRKIHEQGGYVGDGELDNYGDEVAATPFIEDEATGKRRKVSRFKAARMKQ